MINFFVDVLWFCYFAIMFILIGYHIAIEKHKHSFREATIVALTFIFWPVLLVIGLWFEHVNKYGR